MQSITTALEGVQIWLGLFGLVLVIVLVALQFGRSWALLRRFYKDQKCGDAAPVAGNLLAVYARSVEPLNIGTWVATNFFDNVRRRLEHDIFHPRADAVAAGKVEAWRASLARAFETGAVAIDTPKEIANREEAIRRYFAIVKDLKGSAASFLLAADVKDGFIAPLHLVAGLLHRVNDEWSEILKVYKADLDAERTAAAGAVWERAIKAIRTIQKFTFDCWLLWGPSIPICQSDCDNHAGAMSSVQFGYGDENSSVELIARHDVLAAQLAALAAHRRRDELAVNVSVRGWVSHTSVFSAADAMGKSIKKSWAADDDGRALLLLERGGAAAGAVQPKAEPSYYYTAYVWVCLVVLREDGGVWRPPYHDPYNRSERPWLDFIPFFEHGNIADAPTYRFLKRQLARKALAGIARFVDDWEQANPGAPYPLKFAYACAIDDSGCGKDVKFTNADDRGDLRAALGELLQQGDYARLASVVDLSLYDPPNGHPHAACEMPGALTRFYKHVKAVSEDAA